MTADARVITLGRGTPTQQDFRVMTTRTLAQDVWLTRAVRVAGLDQVRIPANAGKDLEVFNGFLTALVEKVFAADVVGDLLAGVLVPVSATRWTTAQAQTAKEFLLDVPDEEEKKVLLALLAEILQGFLSSGRSS